LDVKFLEKFDIRDASIVAYRVSSYYESR